MRKLAFGIIVLFCAVVFGSMFYCAVADAQESKTPDQVAEECETGRGSVLVRDVQDKARVELPPGRAMKDYVLAYADGGMPNALCVRTRPFAEGEVAKSYLLLFGDATRRFDIVEREASAKRARTKTK